MGSRGWAYSELEMDKLIKAGKILFGKDESVMPQLKNYLFEDDTSLAKSVLFFDTQSTTKWIKANKFEFAFPKPIELLEHIFQMYPDKNALILDSFAGSGTTAHAVINLNKSDCGNRKFILIEMEDYAESITAERVRRIGGNFDYYEVGAKVFIDDEINADLDIEKVREYIWQADTHTEYLKPTGDCPEFIGVHKNVAYYFTESLNYDFLATMRTRAEEYVIYAESCAIDKDFLYKYKIEFRKIPRDIMRYDIN